MLTHDVKFDPLLLIALGTKAGYIGAMGSRRTHQKPVEAVREAGVTDEQLARISAPIGLDIGASAPRSSRCVAGAAEAACAPLAT